jgi:hypothetical protein
MQLMQRTASQPRVRAAAISPDSQPKQRSQEKRETALEFHFAPGLIQNPQAALAALISLSQSLLAVSLHAITKGKDVPVFFSSFLGCRLRVAACRERTNGGAQAEAAISTAALFPDTALSTTSTSRWLSA